MTTQQTTPIAFEDGAVLTIGTATYELSLVSTWEAPNHTMRTTGHVDMHDSRTGHGWGGEMSIETWEALQTKGVR